MARGSGPYLYLPKLESHHEARLWNEVFIHAQDALGVPRGSVRATVLIETITAAFEMDEILYELREHAAGLNAGRWDYLFSAIKTVPRRRPTSRRPDRSQLTMTVPFMRAYTELLVQTCHRRGAHAIGGMAAFIPNRRDPEVTETALAKVRDDKERESRDGFDGTWVAHPDLVPAGHRDLRCGARRRPEPEGAGCARTCRCRPPSCSTSTVEGGTVTEAGVRANIRVALAYLDAWLRGTGAAAIDNLMEDAATAEIARSQLWLWRTRGLLPDRRSTPRSATKSSPAWAAPETGRLKDAWDVLDHLVLDDDFAEFLTLAGVPAARLSRSGRWRTGRPRAPDASAFAQPVMHISARQSESYRLMHLGGINGVADSRQPTRQPRVTGDLQVHLSNIVRRFGGCGAPGSRPPIDATTFANRPNRTPDSLPVSKREIADCASPLAFARSRCDQPIRSDAA